MKNYLAHFKDDDSKRILKAKSRKEADRDIVNAYPDRFFWLFEITSNEAEAFGKDMKP